MKWNRLKSKLEDLKWQIKWRLPPHRYHIINISGQDDYKVGWLDADNKMFLACFKIFCDYMENERPFEVIAWEPQTTEDKNDPTMVEYWEQAKKDKEEIEFLYRWWTIYRPQEKRDLELLAEEIGSYGKLDFESGMSRMIQNPKWRYWCEASDRFEARDDEMLYRLLKIRKILWT